MDLFFYIPSVLCIDIIKPCSIICSVNIKINTSTTFPVALYGLRVFENRVPNRIFGIQKEEVTGGSMKLQNVDLHKLQ